MTNSQKIKVLFVIDSLACGGAEKSLLTLLPLLDHNKMVIDLLVITRGGILEQYIQNNIRIISLPKTTKFGTLSFKFRQLCFSVQLRILKLLRIREHGAETRWKTMGPSYPKLNTIYDVAIAYQQGLPTYYVAEKVNATRKYAWINADIKNFGYSENFNKKFYNSMTNVITVSNRLNSIMRRTEYTDPTKLLTIFDIINTDLIKRMSLDPIPSECKKAPYSLCITTVGRMEKPKNYPLAVEVAKILKDNGLKFHWYFVGDGSERFHVENLIERYCLQNEITLAGLQPNPYPYMAKCDIYVQTSSAEGFCLTTCEAKLLNKPIVSTNFPVIHDQITNGVNGLIAEMTPDSISEKIMLLVNDSNLRNKIIDATKIEINKTTITESTKVNNLILNED